MFIIQGISSALGTGYESRTHDHGVKVRGLTAWLNPHSMTVFAWTVISQLFFVDVSLPDGLSFRHFYEGCHFS